MKATLDCDEDEDEDERNANARLLLPIIEVLYISRRYEMCCVL
jgi:hypothetical protein